MGNRGLKMWCGFVSPAARALALHFSSIYRDTDTWKSTCNHAGFPMSKRLRKRKNTFSHLPELYLLIFFHFFPYFSLISAPSSPPWKVTRVTNLCEAVMDAGKFPPQPFPLLLPWKVKRSFSLEKPKRHSTFLPVESGSWLWCSELSMRVLDLVIP